MREPPTLKGLVRAMNRGNLPKTKYSASHSFPDSRIPEVYTRSQNLSNKIVDNLVDKYRRRDLTNTALQVENNKLEMLAHHVPNRLLPIIVTAEAEALEDVTGVPVGEVLGEFKKGGMVNKTGLYKLHKGEKVIPANQVKKNKNKYKK